VLNAARLDAASARSAVIKGLLMLSISDLRFFEVIASSPTLAAAARALDVTAPSVTQRLQNLEARLQVRLVDRSTRHFALTDEGRLLAERARSLIEEVDSIADVLAKRRGAVSGHLRVMASFGFGRRFIAPVAAQFRAAHPETIVELLLSENPTRLANERWDVLIHVGELKDSALVARRVAENRRIACAAPDYIRRRGAPRSPAELRDHDCMALRENDEDVTLWRFTKPDGDTAVVRINAAMASNDGEVIHNWALAGLGIILRSEWHVADDLKQGRLVHVLPEWRLPSADIVALLQTRRRRTERATRFLNYLSRSLANPPWRA
jgi:DNA-binding transcriptional LysR family regulator